MNVNTTYNISMSLNSLLKCRWTTSISAHYPSEQRVPNSMCSNIYVTWGSFFCSSQISQLHRKHIKQQSGLVDAYQQSAPNNTKYFPAQHWDSHIGLWTARRMPKQAHAFRTTTCSIPELEIAISEQHHNANETFTSNPNTPMMDPYSEGAATSPTVNKVSAIVVVNDRLPNETSWR